MSNNESITTDYFRVLDGREMNRIRRMGTRRLVFCTLGCLAYALSALPQTKSAATEVPEQQARDGQHDFDFNIGTWKTHITRLQQPLASSTTWIKLEGRVTVRKVWDGRAQLEEIALPGPPTFINWMPATPDRFFIFGSVSSRNSLRKLTTC